VLTRPDDLAGTAVGDGRILNDDGTNVTIRIKNYRHEGREEELTMSGVEFVRRFALHILPPYFRRIRYAGLLCQRRRHEYLAVCREMLKDRIAPERTDESDGLEQVDSGGADHLAELFADRDDDEQPKPPKACPRCLGREFDFVESYRPQRRAKHRPTPLKLPPLFVQTASIQPRPP